MPAPRRGSPLILTASVDGALEQPDPGRGPRFDYLEFARLLGATVLHPQIADGALGRLEAGTRKFGDWRQAWRARQSDASAFLSMTEKSALGVVALDRSRPHVAITQHLTSPRRQALQRRTHWLQRLDRVIALSRRQQAYLLEQAEVPAERVRLVLRGVDQRFFAPQGDHLEGYVASAGQTGRDYATLIAAAARSGVPTVIAAASPWVTEQARISGELPANVTVHGRLDRVALRDIYDRAAAIVVPLQPGMEIAAGVNATLEAMAMGKPVVVSATPGISDYLIEGETGELVAAADPAALAEALGGLMSDAPRRARLGAAARAYTEGEGSLDAFAGRVRDVFAEVAELPSLTSAGR